MQFRLNFKKFFYLTLSLCVAQFANAQAESSQLGFSALQAQANVLAGQGKLVEAKPLLLELVKRVKATESVDEEMRLDFPYFLIGTAHI